MRRVVYFAVVCVTVLAPTGQAQAGPLFGVRIPSFLVGGDAELVTIDMTTGAATDVGPLGSSVVRGLAFDSSGVLFGVDSSTGQLLSINTTTGAATNVVSFGGFGNSITNLAFDSSGTLFGVEQFGFGGISLVTINTATGVTTTIGSLATGLGGITSLAFDSGDTLFGVASPFFGGGDAQLVRIDATTGVATVVGSLGFPSFVAGLSFDSSGTLFGAADQLLRINSTTGAATIVGPFGPSDIFGPTNVPAIAFQPSAAAAAVPEPSSIILFGLGFVGIALCAARRRRDRQSI